MKTPNPIRSFLALGVACLVIASSTLIAHADQNGEKPYKGNMTKVYSETVFNLFGGSPLDARGTVAGDGNLVDLKGQEIPLGPDAKPRQAFTNPDGAKAVLESARNNYAFPWLEYSDSYVEWEAWSNFGGHGTVISIQANLVNLVTSELVSVLWIESTWADGSVTWESSLVNLVGMGPENLIGNTTVVGGTGRFAGAAGIAEVKGDYVMQPESTVVEVTGKISTIGSKKR